jgi:hypothetical protein
MYFYAIKIERGFSNGFWKKNVDVLGEGGKLVNRRTVAEIYIVKQQHKKINHIHNVEHYWFFSTCIYVQ